MIRFLLLLLSLPVLAFSQGSTNDYLLSQKPASGPLLVRPVTPAVGQLLGWPTSINTPAAITLGTGLSLSGSTLNATAGTPAWGDITGIPAAVTNLSGTNTGDNAVNSNYSGLVTNATHTGDATGATALTLATVNSNVGSFGSATAAPAITVNAKGLVTAVTTHTITPAWGNITGIPAAVTNLSGTNTGDQTITLTGDVTGSGTGTFAATIANDAVTFAKMQEISGTHLVGRHGSGSGNIQEVSVGDGVEFQGSGIRRSALTGDVTAPAGNNTTTLATVNSNVGSFGSATAAPAVTVNAKGLVTAVTTNTITPAVGSITGLGTGVSTFLGTPTLANLNTAVSDADLATLGANTFTGNQTINGTLDVTGQFGPAIERQLCTPNAWLIPWDGWGAQTLSGTGSISASGWGLNCQTGATASSRAQRTLSTIVGDFFWGQPNIGTQQINWAKRFTVGFTINPISSSTNGQWFIRIGDNASTTGNLSGRGVGIRMNNGAIAGQVHDGTTLNTSSTLKTVTLGGNQTTWIVIQSDGAGNVQFWVDNSLEVTLTGGPTAAAVSVVAVEALNNADSSSTRVHLSPLKVFITP